MFMIKYGFHLLFNYPKIKKEKSMKKIYKILYSFDANRDNLKFAFLMSLINITYKIILCTLRKHTKWPDSKIAPISGFISGLWLYLDGNKTRRNWLTVLLVSRAIETIINKIMRPKCLKNHNVTNKEFILNQSESKKLWILTLFFGMSTFVNMLGGNLDPDVVQPSMYRLSMRWACYETNDHVVFGHVDDPLGRKPLYSTL